MDTKERVRDWVRGFNAFPETMIEQLMEGEHFDEWQEVTAGKTADEDYLPMWGTLWQFDTGFDNHWLEEGNGIEAMSKCGFRVYYHEEWGYFFGVDGAGYDFYEAHWIPLYKARFGED